MGTVSTAYTNATVTATGGSGSYNWSQSGLPGTLTLAAGPAATVFDHRHANCRGFLHGYDNRDGHPEQCPDQFGHLQRRYHSRPAQAHHADGASSAGGSRQRCSGSYAASGGTPGTAGYTYSASGLPTGVTINAATGAFAGAPSIAGVFNFTVQVTDSNSNTATATGAVNVLGFTSASVLPQGQVQGLYSTTFSTTGAGSATVTYASNTVSAGLPNAAGVLTGSPTTAGTATTSGSTTTYAPFTLTVTATVATTTGNVTASAQFSWVVTPAPVPLSITGQLPAGQVKTSYSASVSGNGGTPPYSYSITGGALPGNFSLGTGTNGQTAGQITGSPTAAGSYSFVVQVTDSTTPTAKNRPGAVYDPDRTGESDCIRNLPARRGWCCISGPTTHGERRRCPVYDLHGFRHSSAGTHPRTVPFPGRRQRLGLSISSFRLPIRMCRRPQ